MTAIDWTPWRPLMGDWVARGGGAPGEGDGTFSFTLELEDQVLIRRARTDYTPTAQRPASVYLDMLVVYADGGGFSAIAFDSEGHVIRYRTEISERRVVLVSEPVSGAPRFRLTYELRGSQALDVRFEIAPPGSETFALYVSGTAERKIAA
jgi:hypothetical protein